MRLPSSPPDDKDFLAHRLVEGSTAGLGPLFLCYLGGSLGRVALDASASRGGVASDLSAHFSEVHVLREDAASLADIRASGVRVGDAPYIEAKGTIFDVHWPDHTFDCIAVHDGLAKRRIRGHQLAAELDRLRQLLTPQGWLIGASPNPRHVGRRAHVGGLSPWKVVRLLRVARFQEVRVIFVRPSLDRPLALIPDASYAIRAYEGLDSISGSTSWMRRAVASIGLPALLYPAYFVLARA